MKRRKGFVLITSAASLIGLLIVVGLAVDVGRLYVAQGELQVFADEAAIAAAFELDGTDAGLTRARSAAAAGPGSGASPNRWNFASQPVRDVTVEFAGAAAGGYDSNPTSAVGLRFVKVRAAGAVNLFFLPLLPSIGAAQNPMAAAIAGQTRQRSLGNGLAPFSPTAHDQTDANYGFARGGIYTLRWAPSGQRGSGGTCAGDSDFDPGSSSERGYVDVGQGSGSSALRAVVINNSFFLPAPLTVGGTLRMYTGQESVPDAMEQRYAQDTDVTSTWFADYRGNGRRLLSVAVNGGGDPATVLGFASFFLHPTPCGTKNTTPCCAEYVGAAVLNGTHRGAGDSGLYAVQLVQ